MNQDEYVDTLSRFDLALNTASRQKTLDLLVTISDRAENELHRALNDLNAAVLDYHDLNQQFPIAGEVVAMRSSYGIARAPTLLPAISLEADVFGKREELRANEILLAAIKGAKSFNGTSSLSLEAGKVNRLIKRQRSEIMAIEASNPTMMEPTVGHVMEYRHNKVRALKEVILELEAAQSILRGANERGRNHYVLTVKQKAANRIREARINSKIKAAKEQLTREEASLSVLPTTFSSSQSSDSLHVDVNVRLVKNVERCKRSIEELRFQLPFELKAFTDSCQRDAQILLQGAEVLTSGGFISRFAQGAAVLLRQHAKVLLCNVRRASSTKLTSLPVLPVSPASDLLAGIMSILEARTEQLEKSSAPTGERAWASSALVSPPSCTTSACCGIKSLRCELCFDGTMPSLSQVKFLNLDVEVVSFFTFFYHLPCSFKDESSITKRHRSNMQIDVC
jgi:hypothetical protein